MLTTVRAPSMYNMYNVVIEGTFKRNKMLLIHFNGDSCSGLARAKLNSHGHKAEAAFGDTNVSSGCVHTWQPLRAWGVCLRALLFSPCIFSLFLFFCHSIIIAFIGFLFVSLSAFVFRFGCAHT